MVLTKTKKMLLTSFLIVFCMAVGALLGFSPVGAKVNSMLNSNKISDQIYTDMRASDDNLTLPEEMYPVDLIIKGKVLSLDQSYQRNANVETKMGALTYDVTPATVEVEDVLYGTVFNKTITLLQHGTPSNSEAARHFVNAGDEVYLMLVKTDDGKYWSYNFDDGVWKINNGKVQSLTNKSVFKQFNHGDATSFANAIKNAAKAKVKRPNTIYNN